MSEIEKEKVKKKKKKQIKKQKKKLIKILFLFMFGELPVNYKKKNNFYFSILYLKKKKGFKILT